ncbi:HNH endonuclease [Hymenobacter agri]
MKNKIDWPTEFNRLKGQAVIVGAGYYHMCLLSKDAETAYYTCTGQFAGWTDTKPAREIREASKIQPDKMIRLLLSIKEPAIIVNNDYDAQLFVLLGGHALLHEDVARRKFSNVLQPEEVVTSHSPESAEGQFQSISVVPSKKLIHAPDPKLRMLIIKRDHFKCRVCGRSPNTNTDIELHVHHIKPFSVGGLTEKENLITLCHTCHKGLDPHYEWELFNFIGTHPLGGAFQKIGDKVEYHQLVDNYRKYASKTMTKFASKKLKAKK